jgi:hypothetical protein
MARNGKRSKKWIVITAVGLMVLGGAGYKLRGALKTDPKIDASKLVTIERGDLARSVVAT